MGDSFPIHFLFNFYSFLIQFPIISYSFLIHFLFITTTIHFLLYSVLILRKSQVFIDSFRVVQPLNQLAAANRMALNENEWVYSRLILSHSMPIRFTRFRNPDHNFNKLVLCTFPSLYCAGFFEDVGTCIQCV